MATVGDDFTPYEKHLDKLGISRRYVRLMEGEFTPQAFITTDIDDNQITAFHPGAMQHSYLNKDGNTSGIRIGMVAPDSKKGMIQHSQDFVEQGIPHIFDPGQGITQFNGEELSQFIHEAQYVVVNDYEFHLLEERTGQNGEAIAKKVEALIITRGPEGSLIRTRDGEQEVAVVKADEIKDPTGCGDAFRSGLLYGLLNDLDLVTMCRIGSVMGSIKIAHQGCQNHQPSLDEIKDRFFEAYGYRF